MDLGGYIVRSSIWWGSVLRRGAIVLRRVRIVTGEGRVNVSCFEEGSRRRRRNDISKTRGWEREGDVEMGVGGREVMMVLVVVVEKVRRRENVLGGA
jgi:hypothetical protein